MARPVRRSLRSVAVALGLLAVLASALVGSGALGMRTDLFGSVTPPAQPAASSRVATGPGAATAKTVLRSEPWWQRVAAFQGTGTGTTPRFATAAGALRLRVHATCQRGHLVVRAASGSAPLIDAACPASRTGSTIAQPEGSLRVTADGPWTMRVEQQIAVPLIEPPLPAMTAPGAARAATGSFYRITQVGVGKAIVYRLANGRFALRLQDFYVSPNVDLQVRLSPLRAPHSTREYQSAPSAYVGPLDVTTGSLNFRVPRGVDPTRYHSVVIWCPPTARAYAAATITPAR
jgi:Electron transfer DM13